MQLWAGLGWSGLGLVMGLGMRLWGLWAVMAFCSCAALKTMFRRTAASFLLVATAPLSPVLAVSVQELLRDGAQNFVAGRVSESVASFREAERLAPNLRPNLWQKGLAEYANGDYTSCASQFSDGLRSHPTDAEETVFFLACTFRATKNGIDSHVLDAALNEAAAARKPDRRAVMNIVYDVFAGRQAPDALEKILSAVPSSLTTGYTINTLDQQQRFYAALYLGLHAEAVLGDETRAANLYEQALHLEYSKATNDYMVATCRVLFNRLR